MHRIAARVAAMLVVAIALGTAALAVEPTKLDAALREWLDGGPGLAGARGAPTFQLSVAPSGEVRAKVLVLTVDGVDPTSVGGTSGGFSTGRLAARLVTTGELAAMASDERVVYVEASRPTRPSLDASIPVVGGDRVHDASPAVRGRGAIVGLIDTGVDYEHLDFRVDRDGDGDEEGSRIAALWDQTFGLFGTKVERADIEWDLALGLGPDAGRVRQADRDGHGTHVAATAAGDGSASGGTFVGLAPEADLVVVKTTFFTADILAGVEYVFDEAARRGKPAVVNLSLGGHDGPHDGTSLFEQGLDDLAQGPGRAIVVSAGNEGDLAIHVSGTLQGGARSFDVTPGGWQFEMKLWTPGDAAFSVAVTSPSGQTATASAGATTGVVLTADGLAIIDNASGGTNPNNGDREVLVRITNSAPDAEWTVTVRDAGGGGRFDGWVTTNDGRIVGGDSASTIDEPGNADRVLTVGAFNSKATWPSAAGPQDRLADFPIGALSSFSSQGPTRDGRVKPDLAAPGAWICAALSSSAPSFDIYRHPNGLHTMEIGTSMAAPHVTGAIALLFSLDPSMTPDDVRAALTAAAARDAFTGTTPNVRWGWGKLDVEAAVAGVEIPEPSPAPGRPIVRVLEQPVREEARFEVELPPGGATAELRVYEVDGALLARLDVPTGGGAVVWNLVSDGGARVAAGLYLYVVVAPSGASDVGRLVIAP
ncbi:MAG: S8 family serine peptidase [Candidatus Bipolaricaulota bacterium]